MYCSLGATIGTRSTPSIFTPRVDQGCLLHADRRVSHVPEVILGNRDDLPPRATQQPVHRTATERAGINPDDRAASQENSRENGTGNRESNASNDDGAGSH